MAKVEYLDSDNVTEVSLVNDAGYLDRPRGRGIQETN